MPLNLNTNWNNDINSLSSIQEIIKYIDDNGTKDEHWRLAHAIKVMEKMNNTDDLILNPPKEVTYDDTRDVAVRCVKRLIELGYIKDDNNTYLDIQDSIQDEINKVLGIDIDDKFSVSINQNT
tara:strand:- start:353 stop:721 length:369 start_codon:yes stop_codon:yes gene_type:complete